MLSAFVGRKGVDNQKEVMYNYMMTAFYAMLTNLHGVYDESIDFKP